MTGKLGKVLVWALLIVSFVVAVGIALPTGSTSSTLLAEDALSKYNAMSSTGATPNPTAPLELLPAWRWNGSVSLTSQYDITDATNAGGNAVAIFLLGVGTFAWNITLLLLNFAMTTDLVAAATTLINRVFYQLANGIWSSGVVIVVMAIAMLAGARLMMKGKLTGALSMLFMFLIPIAFLQFATTKVASAGYDSAAFDPKNPPPTPRWSPAWIAQTGSDAVNTLGEGVLLNLANRVGAATGTSTKYFSTSPGPSSEGYTNQVDCNQYTAALNLQYLLRRGTASSDGSQNPYGVINKGSKGSYDSPGAQAMIMASDAWTSAFLTNFAKANFGDEQIGMAASCKLLELERGVTLAESYAVVGGEVDSNFNIVRRPSADAFAFGSGRPSAVPADNTNGFAGWGPRPFHQVWPDASRKGAEQVFAWSACANNAGTSLAGGWQYLGGGVGKGAGEVDQNSMAIQDTDCRRWSQAPLWSTSTDAQDVDPNAIPNYLFGPPQDAAGWSDSGTWQDLNFPLTGSKPDDVSEWTRAGAGMSQSQTEQLSAVGNSIKSFWGMNIGYRVANSAIAALSGVLYLLSFGAIALGVIIAQLGLILLLAILPVTLIMLALPSEKKGSNPGLRLLKMTFGMLMSKFVLTATITLMVILTSVFANAAGVMNSALVPFAPLAAFFALRELYKRAGLGDVMSPGGALGMATRGGLTSAAGKSTATGVLGKSQDANLRRKAVGGARSLDRRRRENHRKRIAQEQLTEAKKQSELTRAALGGGTKGEDTAPKSPAEKQATSAANQRKAAEALDKGVRGDTAAVAAVTAAGALKDGRMLPDATAKLSPQGSIKNPAEARGLLERAKGGSAANSFETYKKHQENMGELAALGLDEIAALQGLEDPLTLSEAAKSERILEAAAAAGVDPSLIGKDSLPLEPMVTSGAVEGLLDSSMIVRNASDGTIDYDATRARITAQAALTVSTVASISDISQDLHSKFGEMFTLEDCQRAVTHTVLFDAGLSDSLGVTVDPFAAAGMSEADIKSAIDDMARGIKCDQLVKLAVEYDARSAVLQDGWKGSMSAAAEDVLSRIKVTPVQSVVQVQAQLSAPRDVVSQHTAQLTALLEAVPGGGGDAVDRLAGALDGIASDYADALRSQIMAGANVEISQVRLSGAGTDAGTLADAQVRLSGVQAIERELAQQLANARQSIIAYEDPGEQIRSVLHTLGTYANSSDSESQRLSGIAQQVQDELAARTPRSDRKPAPMP